MKESATPCPYCGYCAGLVHVHGHAQCGHCGINISPCCSGASADEAATTSGEGLLPEPQLFARLFASLGGKDATVTESSLLQAVVQRLDCDLATARMVLAAGCRVGLIAQDGAAYHLR